MKLSLCHIVWQYDISSTFNTYIIKKNGELFPDKYIMTLTIQQWQSIEYDNRCILFNVQISIHYIVCSSYNRPPSRRRISELAAEFLSAEYQPKKIRLAESAAEFLTP